MIWGKLHYEMWNYCSLLHVTETVCAVSNAMGGVYINEWGER